jgi:hypothetical protein
LIDRQMGLVEWKLIMFDCDIANGKYVIICDHFVSYKNSKIILFRPASVTRWIMQFSKHSNNKILVDLDVRCLHFH